MKSVSITIPSRNEENYIAKCLQSIVDCDYPKDQLSVFVCDGLSTDRTVELVNEFANKYSYIHLLINEKQTTPYALNLGLKAGDADYKIILGAHAEIYSDFISKNIAIFESENNEKLACVGGVLENIYENSDSEIIGYAMSTPFGVGNAHFRTGAKSGYVDTVAFGAYKSEVFDKIGYFDEDLARNQDDEFNYRILKNDFEIYLSNQIKSKYYVRASFSKLFKQYYQYGYWKVIVNKKHKNITTLRQIVPALFVVFLTIGIFSSWFHLIFLSFYVLGLVLYLTMAIVETLKTDFNFQAKLMLIKTFLILHISYGLGYLSAIKNMIFLRTFATEKKMEITR